MNSTTSIPKALIAVAGVALVVGAAQTTVGAQRARVIIDLPKVPTVKPPVVRPPVMGTTQLAGDNGELGQTYTMGRAGRLNFTLNSASYSVDRLNVGNRAYTPTKDEKMLLLRFTVQNPNKQETLFRFDSFNVTGVDSKDTNRSWIRDIVKPDAPKEPLSIHLKPGQKVEALSALIVPADTEIPKLMVAHYSGGKVLRYDMHNKITPLPAPFADPAAPTGTVARAEIPAAPSTLYVLERFDVGDVTSVQALETALQRTPGPGKQFLAIKFTLKNGTNRPQHYRFDTFGARLIDSNGEKEECRGNMLLKGTRDDVADGSLEPGESYTARLVVRAPKDFVPAKVALWEGRSHVFVFDLPPVTK